MHFRQVTLPSTETLSSKPSSKSALPPAATPLRDISNCIQTIKAEADKTSKTLSQLAIREHYTSCKISGAEFTTARRHNTANGLIFALCRTHNRCHKSKSHESRTSNTTRYKCK